MPDYHYQDHSARNYSGENFFPKVSPTSGWLQVTYSVPYKLHQHNLYFKMSEVYTGQWKKSFTLKISEVEPLLPPRWTTLYGTHLSPPLNMVFKSRKIEQKIMLRLWPWCHRLQWQSISFWLFHIAQSGMNSHPLSVEWAFIVSSLVTDSLHICLTYIILYIQGTFELFLSLIFLEGNKFKHVPLMWGILYRFPYSFLEPS